MTSSSPKKRPTTARRSRGPWTSRGLCAASLLGGCLAAAAFAGNPGDVISTNTQQPVTVYYERMPDGTIRQISSAAATPAQVEKKADPVVKPAAALPPGMQYTAPMPQPEIKTIAVMPIPAPAMQPMRIDQQIIPMQKEVVTSPPAPAVMPPVTYTYNRIEYNTPTTMPAAPRMPAPVAPSITPVSMQQSDVLPGLPPLPEPITRTRMQTPYAQLPSSPSTVPVDPKTIPSTITQPPTVNTDTPAQPDSDRETLADYNIQTSPPTLERLYRIDSEANLKTRLVDEIKHRPLKPGETPPKVEFPTYRPLSEEPYHARQFGGLIKQIEPNYLMHGRLYCEDLNSERYGWDLGLVQPLVSSACAAKDFLLLPYNFATRPCQRFESSAGKCYPGDPVPYLLYPPELSITGGAWEAGIFLAAFALVP